MMKEKPSIAVTMGDPSGIGPEICVRLLKEIESLQECTPVIFGDSRIMKFLIFRRPFLKISTFFVAKSQEILDSRRIFYCFDVSAKFAEIPKKIHQTWLKLDNI